ncbi:uncharacterized protein DUF1127 [Litoreibacter meonggei]|uniref:Uncharacterized protein DUF1127 n=1 Tax=Litoreibacter meonggei TaxID=1049199 RepID=A0A497WTU8_9RHOB|nr:DUF1127 domain-containing protein [Litoreibacter meonggei]RLJ59147.1 uncharacterized protein DUF1127 [Litoreibacter meonggei]
MTDCTSSAALTRPADRKTGLLGYLDLYRQRRALAALDDTRLADIGLSRQEAEAEASRPVWDAPEYWK